MSVGMGLNPLSPLSHEAGGLNGINIVSDRIVLRNVIQKDFERIFELANNLKIASMMNGFMPYPYQFKDAQLWGSKHMKDAWDSNCIALVIILKESNILIGSIQIRLLEKRNIARLSYWIGENYWGNGYASIAVNELIKKVFAISDIDIIEAEHLKSNERSGKVLLKCGFKHVSSIIKVEGFSKQEADFECYELKKSNYIYN